MSAFGIPDAADAEREMHRALHISAEVRAEAWEIAIEQAATTQQLDALTATLARRVESYRKLEAPLDSLRHAQWLIAERRQEILAAEGGCQHAPRRYRDDEAMKD